MASELEEYVPKADWRYAAKSCCRGAGGRCAGGAPRGVVVERRKASGCVVDDGEICRGRLLAKAA